MPPGGARRRPAATPLLLLLAALACGPRLAPDQQIELLRSQYSAQLRSLTVKQDPVETAALDGAAPAVRTDAILDIVLETTGPRYLPGLTLDIRQVDARRIDKSRHRVWVDTSSLVQGGATQVEHVLENVEWETGDGFLVEVRAPVPPGERAEYREFETD